MIVLEEHIVQIFILSEPKCDLVHMWWNITNLIDNSRPDLSNMHVDHQAIVAIDLKQFVLCQVFCVNIMLNVAMLVG